MRYYYRRRGYSRRALPAPGSPGFDAAYAAATPINRADVRIRKTRRAIAIDEALERAFLTAKWRAPRRNLSFELTLDDVRHLYESQRGRCAISGRKLGWERKGSPQYHKAPYAPSLDRLDNSKGYVHGNVRLACVAANFALGEWGEEVFADIAAGFLRKREGRKNTA